MYKNEVAIKLLDKISQICPGIDTYSLRTCIDEVLYLYKIEKAEETALVVRSNLTDLVKLFLACKKLDGLSKYTLQNYGYKLKRFALYMNKNAEDITTMDLRMYLASYQKFSGVKNTTVESEISTLRSFFEWLEKEEYISKDPTRKLNRIKTEKRQRKALTVEELELLREACKNLRERALLEFFYSTGCRLSEVVNLNRLDIDWDNLKTQVIGKGNKERTVYISPKAKIHLKKYLMSRLDTNEALFVTERQPYRRLGQRAIQREFEKLGKRAGLNKNIHPHLLRHTTATLMLNNGADLVTVQNILGHTSPNTTQIYAKASNEKIEYEYRKHLIQ